MTHDVRSKAGITSTQFKSMRSKLGLTQIQLAEIAGVTQGTITQIETGRIKPSHTLSVQLLTMLLGQTMSTRIKEELRQKYQAYTQVVEKAEMKEGWGKNINDWNELDTDLKRLALSKVTEEG